VNRKNPALNFASIIARPVVPATVSLHPFGRGLLRTFADLNRRVAKVQQYLIKVAHIEPLSAARTFHEIRIDAAILSGFRHRSLTGFRWPQSHAIAQTRTHAGIVKVKRYAFAMP